LAKLTRPPSRVRRLSSFSIVIEARSRFAQWPLTNGPPCFSCAIPTSC
jgi:hypothetical protein